MAHFSKLKKTIAGLVGTVIAASSIPFTGAGTIASAA